MQLIAMLTMLIDHIGYIFFPQDLGWRYIGRIAFPIYCYALVQGHLYTSSKSRYLLRLLIIALITQIPYNLALDPGGLNVVFTLLLSELVLIALDKLPKLWMGIGVAAPILWVMDYFPLDYNAYGLLLVLIFRYARSYGLVLAHLTLNAVYMFYYGRLRSRALGATAKAARSALGLVVILPGAPGCACHHPAIILWRIAGNGLEKYFRYVKVCKIGMPYPFTEYPSPEIIILHV
ncbi:TraX family protein [Paenibacillus zanthoxyli]|uniref:TraX family protein n=1 Tax=Paenibacillus zanthoxyli TaxID=369399 RepID=UPI0004AF73C7|nr:TraX family protein [Paenibacillus zanthoxyli]